MGDNFKRYLEESEPALTADMLKLLRAITAVVGSVDNPQGQITWGQRSRHNLTNIQPRVNYAV